MSTVVKEHIYRLRSETTNKLGLKDLVTWIPKHTRINGRPFSFKGHEYQQRIISDTSAERVIQKSAQTGLSEMSLREAAGKMAVMPRGYAIGYTFPTAGFASQYSRTRFDPIVMDSKTLRALGSEGIIDNAEVKSFSGNRFIYFKGAAVGNAAISTSLDELYHDELDFSDQQIIGDYTSRMIHSQHKRRTRLSTPTFPGGPINKAFMSSRRHYNMCRCDHCSHVFLPSYYDHVVIPGYSGALDEITEDNLHRVRFQEATLLCPKCGKVPDLSPPFREWVVENPDENHVAVGFQVSPFDAPTIVTVPYLIEASTKYRTKARFMNFNLGLPAEDAESGLTVEDINGARVPEDSASFNTHVMGVDLGSVCHFTVGGVAHDGTLVVVKRKRCTVGEFRKTYAALVAEYRVLLTVSDSQPYVETVLDMQKSDPNLYGAFYVKKQGLDLFEVRQREENSDSALAELRQVSVNRNAVLDKLMQEIRDGGIKFAEEQSEFEVARNHLVAMRRAAATLSNGEFMTNWVKPENGQDHYHHSTLYLWVAAQMRGVAVGAMSGLNFGIQTFRVKS